jgi:NDP-sugar pyrophosphorylase family protein
VTKALIMAGGRGERLRASGALTPKPLVAIRGLCLLEHNLLRLLSSGFRDIVVAVPAHTPEIAQFVRTRGQSLAEAFGCRVRLFEETRPLGNIGAAAELETGDSDLLVVYADNLTALDLNGLVRHHRGTGAALTSAVHLEPFRIPYGEVQVRDEMIVGYLEKPERSILVSSGVFVLSPEAIAGLPRGRRTEVAWLANRLLEIRAKVAAFRHDAPWIDVNDSAAVARAEQLLADHAEAFEYREAFTKVAPERGV